MINRFFKKYIKQIVAVLVLLNTAVLALEPDDLIYEKIVIGLNFLSWYPIFLSMRKK